MLLMQIVSASEVKMQGVDKLSNLFVLLFESVIVKSSIDMGQC